MKDCKESDFPEDFLYKTVISTKQYLSVHVCVPMYPDAVTVSWSHR